MIEAIVGVLVLLVVFKVLFWIFVLVFSPIILIGGILLSIGIFFVMVVGGVFVLVFKLLFLPVLLLLLIPFCWTA